MDKALKQYLEQVGIKPGSVKEIKASWEQWNFEENPVFIGKFLGETKVIPAGATGELELLAFEKLEDGLTYGIIRSSAIDSAMKDGSLYAGGYFVIHFKGKKELSSGKSFNVYDLYEIEGEEDIPF